MHKQLETAVLDMKAEGKDVPDFVIKTLGQSKTTMQKLANKVSFSEFLQAVLPQGNRVDKAKLLKGEKDSQIASHQTEWHINLGLLITVYEKTTDPEVKKQIEFLALNYLAKAAPVNIANLGLNAETRAKMEELFQYGLINERIYHRELPVYEKYLITNIIQAFPEIPKVNSNKAFILTDTIHYEALLPVSYTVLDTVRDKEDAVALEDNWSDKLATEISNHFSQHSNPFSHWITPPLLCDLTNLLGDFLQTDKDPKKEKDYADRKKEIEELFERAIHKAIKKLEDAHPPLFTKPDDVQKLQVFLKMNLNSICRKELNETAILLPISLFTNPDDYKLPDSVFKKENQMIFLNLNTSEYNSSDMTKDLCQSHQGYNRAHCNNFVNECGLRIGAVRARKKIFNFADLKQFILAAGSEGQQITQYAVSGQADTIFFSKETTDRTTSVTNTNLFKRFKNRMEDPTFAKEQPQITILGQATANILDGLMQEISAEKWNQLHENHDTRMLVQQSLYRAMQHLATAENNTEDFTKFSQAIELLHYEIATILTLSKPFQDSDFQEIYKKNLPIPENLQAHVSAGLGKSAMNIFAGINAVVLEANTHPERVYGDGSYFEEVRLIGENRSTEEILANEKITAVDLYVNEFNHNINIHKDHSHYTPGAIIEEIKTLLEKKKDTSHLTIAIDGTTDLLNSPKVEDLLKHFATEIKQGKLNFVFFRSGQKFDMLGMDNYYGAPFWTVNNGDAKLWGKFDQLHTNKAFQTDSLSIQWFCLANKYAGKQMDDYRKQIFQNTRGILKQIPSEFKPGGKHAQQIRISTVSDDMDPVFIDIKILNSNPELSKHLIQIQLYKKFAEKGVKMHSKGSFGFYHPNFNVIDSIEDKLPRNIRINPGLNPADNQIIIEFLKNLSSLDLPT